VTTKQQPPKKAHVMPNWMKIENLRITTKIALIVALLSAVSIAATGYSALRMKAIGDAYSDLIARVDSSTILAARSNRTVETYLLRGYQLVVETTSEGNARFLMEARKSESDYRTKMDQVRASLPEQAGLIEAAESSVRQAFASCGPVLSFAATTTSAGDNAKAVDRLKTECEPLFQAGIQAQSKLVDGLIAYSGNLSDDLAARSNGTIWTVLTSMSIGLLVALTAALLIGVQGLSRPIGRLNAVMAAFAHDDLTAEIPGVGRGDEVGAMARTVAVFKTNALEVNRLRADLEAQKLRTADERRKAMLDLATRFETNAGGIVTSVTAQATELQATAQSMTSTAEETSRQSAIVAAASDQAMHNVNTVAASTEELSASVREILQQVTRSTQLTRDTLNEATAADQGMQALAAAMERIGQVVGLISGIAGQTNLLALNATIEAARAGDSGKGFAVVAGEVKALADQTAKATQEISKQISAIQEATKGSVRSIQGIVTLIGRVNEAATTIASAVEEQGAATAEIARNVSEAAKGTGEVSNNIASVNMAAQHTGAAASEVLASASNLSQNGEALKMQVDAFLIEVRAA
jgi:methyl-accepting chemotaxis protein